MLGAPFYLMERVHGHSFRTTVPRPGGRGPPGHGGGLVDSGRLRAIDVSRSTGGTAPGGNSRVAPAHGRAGAVGPDAAELDAVGAWLADRVRLAGGGAQHGD